MRAETRTWGARFWRHARAGLVLLGLLGAATMVPPDSGRWGDRKVWRAPHNREQFKRWSQLLGKAGVRVSARDLEATAWRWARRTVAVWAPVQRPLRPFAAQLGFAQGWSMFSNPQTHPARLHIDLDRGMGFEPLYVSRSATLDWRSQQFDHNRMRKFIGRIARTGDETLYNDFARWVAVQARQDFPDAVRLRVRRYRWQTELVQATPATSYDALGSFEGERIVELRSTAE
jgi:hypothetical protein